MADSVKALYPTFVRRSAPKGGPRSSDTWNDTMTELATDLASLSSEWNNNLLGITSGLPDGSDDTAVNAVKNGLDGKNLWVDQGASASDLDTTYYDSTNGRPVTIYEAMEDIYEYFASQITQVRNDLNAQASALTDAEKIAIGSHIFDATQTSSASSLDGKSENNRNNIAQLAADIYGGTEALQNDGSAQLANSVYAMVDALLELHNGDWDNDISLSHTAESFDIYESDVIALTAAESYVATPASLKDNLDNIRYALTQLKGTATWLTALPALYGSGPDSLKDLLDSTSGTGTKSINNPWGYRYDNIEDLSAVLSAISSFTGQTDENDSTPDYGSIYFIGVNDPLETAIEKLDTALYTVSGISEGVSFIGMDDTPAGYSTNANKILTVGTTASGVVFADATIDDTGNIASYAITTTSGVVAGQDIEVTFSGCGLVLSSPNGTRWRIQVDDSGALTTASL